MVIGIGLWFILLILFVVLMVVVGKRRRNDGEDEEVGSGRYRGRGEEEDEVEGEEEGAPENEVEDEVVNPKKSKEDLTPLWKYVTKMEKPKGGGTVKFLCSHCEKIYLGSYTRLRMHLCGNMPCDVGKPKGICTCGAVEKSQRAFYRKEKLKHK